MSLREQFVRAWGLCEFGVKTLVFNDVKQQTVNYILKNPKYTNEKTLKLLLKSVKKHSNDVAKKAAEMSDKLKAI